MTKIETIRNLTDDQVLKLAADHINVSSMLRHLNGSHKDGKCRVAIVERLTEAGGTPPVGPSSLISDEQFVDIIETSNCFSVVLRRMGLNDQGGNRKTIRRRIKRQQLSISHFTPNIAMGRKVYTKEQIFCEGSTYSRTQLRHAVLRYQIVDYECELCDHWKLWEGLVLQIDHKNGINDDNRLENLRFLCPNCHSATDTYAGKNR